MSGLINWKVVISDGGCGLESCNGESEEFFPFNKLVINDLNVGCKGRDALGDAEYAVVKIEVFVFAQLV